MLANVGATFRGVLRARGFAGRKGGEEFAVLLPDTDMAAALEIAERVRAAIAEISLPGTDVSVTASLGVAGYPEHASTLDRLERLADAGVRFVGSDSTGVFCVPSCAHAQRIRTAHEVHFRSSSAALVAGFRPCGHCLPVSERDAS